MVWTPEPLDPYNLAADPQDSEFGLPEGYFDPAQYRGKIASETESRAPVQVSIDPRI